MTSPVHACCWHGHVASCQISCSTGKHNKVSMLVLRGGQACGAWWWDVAVTNCDRVSFHLLIMNLYDVVQDASRRLIKGLGASTEGSRR